MPSIFPKQLSVIDHGIGHIAEPHEGSLELLIPSDQFTVSILPGKASLNTLAFFVNMFYSFKIIQDFVNLFLTFESSQVGLNGWNQSSEQYLISGGGVIESRIQSEV